jgi:hypothetical protein
VISVQIGPAFIGRAVARYFIGLRCLWCDIFHDDLIREHLRHRTWTDIDGRPRPAPWQVGCIDYSAIYTAVAELQEKVDRHYQHEIDRAERLRLQAGE